VLGDPGLPCAKPDEPVTVVQILSDTFFRILLKALCTKPDEPITVVQTLSSTFSVFEAKKFAVPPLGGAAPPKDRNYKLKSVNP